MLYRSRRKLRNFLQYLLLVLGFLFLWCTLTIVILYVQDAVTGETKPERPDYRNRGVQVVVGHYNGNLPQERRRNLTDEEINANNFNPLGWGEGGRAVRLSKEDEVLSDATFGINQFSIFISDRIALNRTLDDYRKPSCRSRKYEDISKLPTTSVIIVYHNEAYSTLLRTTRSVLDRSPRPLLKEIILVDDFSNRTFLKYPTLDEALRHYPVPVKIIRTERRVGLIRARLMGAQEATGDVLTFLDSHCECTQGWLEPLLDRIKKNRKTVVCPVIDVINDRTFQYQKGLDLFRGGFNWNLQFRWYVIPSELARMRADDPSAPIPSPTMAGGLFSIDRNYFEEIGTYDHEMDIWGGENLELSFRIWQCGGRMEIHPCSHVGHIFRHISPHDVPGGSSGKVLDGNMLRVAEIWMDEWKYFFYKLAPQTAKLRNVEDLSERLELRRRLHCKSFRWYLENVFIDHHMPMEGDFFGRICLESESLCLVNRPGDPGTKKHQISMAHCTLGFDYWQFWIYTKHGQLKSDEHMCLSAAQLLHTNAEWTVQLKECAGYDNEHWDYNRQMRTFKHRKSGLCLARRDTLVLNQDNLVPPVLSSCNRDAQEQLKLVAAAPMYGKDCGDSIRIPKGCDLYWTKVCVYGNQKPTSILSRCYGKENTTEILCKVSGVARAGRLLAIMGSSGAGKTTLLNVLTSRNLSGLKVSGFVSVDDRPVNKWMMKEMSAFVQQNDMFIGTLTAREHLLFMAKLQVGSTHSVYEQNLRVEDVIRKMGLSACANTMIGIPDTIKGLSCGEQKRLSFASEILTCPRIFFCDEPTSGLDAFMAGHVVGALKELADAGMTVVITIHQPSSQVYWLFDDLCLMACGRIIFLGPTKDVDPLFASCGYPCPDYHNPADHLIRTLSIISGQRLTSLRTISRIRKAFYCTPNGIDLIRISEKQESKKTIVGVIDETEASFFNMSYPSSFLEQLKALTWRSWLIIVRNPTLLRFKLGQTVICALITGLVYFQTAVTPETIISINGILFNHVRNLNFMLQFPAVPVFTMELAIVLRENSNGIYSSTSYFIGKNLAEFPQYVVLPTLYNVIVYWMAGLSPNMWTFLFATLICVLLTNVAISISYAVATIFGKTDVAMTYLPIFVVPMLAFGGFFITYESIPGYFRWLSALSYFKYSYESLAINEWESIDTIPGCLNQTRRYPSCPRSGAEVLKQVDFDGISKWTDVAILLAMIIIVRLIAYTALLIRAYRSR